MSSVRSSRELNEPDDVDCLDLASRDRADKLLRRLVDYLVLAAPAGTLQVQFTARFKSPVPWYSAY
jgi:hypothetical protein